MKSIIKFATVLAVAVGSVSCLDLDPQDQISDANVWGNANNVQLFANQFYGGLRDFNGGNYRTTVWDGPHSDRRSDLISGSTINVYSNGTNQIPASDGNYTDLYNRIYRTNLLLANVQAEDSRSMMAQPVGEAYFFRAYFHFELVQLYGDCILVQRPLDVGAGELTSERDDRLKVVKAIIADLKEATKYLPDTPTEEGRVAKPAAWAMLSRVALYEGSWQKFHVGNGENTADSKALFQEAWKAADEVIKAGNYQLFRNDQLGDRDSYRYMFLLEDVACNPAGLQKSANTEYILTNRHNSPLKYVGCNLTHGMLNHGDNMITAKLADMYRCQDGLPIDKSPLFKGRATATSEFDNRDNRMNGTMMMVGQKYWDNDGINSSTKVPYSRTTWNDEDLTHARTCEPNKNGLGYANYKWCTERQVDDTQESMDFPVIRYAEVLLNYAEAKFEENDAITDAELNYSLNEVRARSNPKMTKLSNSLCSANGLSMREEIRAERSVELVMEGFRLDDLKRWKTAEVEMPMDIVGVQVTGTWYEGQGMTLPLNEEGRVRLFTGRQWQQKHYLFPLPTDQRQLNPNLGQNPGWE
ncbi:MAG: RagB/SusD family nutrient uptake outer membrane protein [Alistipes sp.]|nr:RagB/SusD family nutrient uptake outer membrane protein [Alistipes sp.]